MTVEDTKIRTESGQTQPKPTPVGKRSKTNVDSWGPRLKKRTFTNRAGECVLVPDWQIRFQTDGRDCWFNLGTPNRSAAAKKAHEIFTFLKANGWDATLEKYKPRPEAKQTLTIEEFREVFRSALERVEAPPNPRTCARYIKSLDFICRHLGITKLADLTSEAVKKFKGDYLKQARADGRDPESIKVSCNAIFRNAASLFSRQMLAEYQGHGLSVSNPFEGLNFRRIKLKPYDPMNREMLNKIWIDAAKLRDGDPDAPEKVVIRTGGKKAKRPDGQKAKRWPEPDFHQPQLGAYVLLLLELGLGLRRHESDKAQWDWFFTDSNGRHYIKVQDTPFFVPKNKERRVIPVEKLLYDAIQATRADASPFIVPGRTPKRYEPGREPKNIVYRCDRHHRTFACWLRKHGITENHPCHVLRKEFGSYVATSFGLFHAQRMLGHSSPQVTEAYYAGLTNLPELNHAKVSG